MSTNTQVKSTNKLLMLLVALVLAVACFAGGGALIFASATENGDGETATGAITVTGVTSDIANKASDKPKITVGDEQLTVDYLYVYVQFGADAANAEISDLQDKTEYQNKVYINGVPFETLTKDSEYSAMNIVLKDGAYQLEIFIERDLLSWTRPNAQAGARNLLANEILVKAGFPLVDGKTLSEDCYMYSSTWSSPTASDKQVFKLGARSEEALEAKIIHASFDVYTVNQYRLILQLESEIDDEAIIFSANGSNGNYLLRRDKATIDNNNNYNPKMTIDGQEVTASEYFDRTGIRASLANYITINGVSVSDWKKLPYEALIKDGRNTEADLHSALGKIDLNAYTDAYIKDGDKIIIELYANTSIPYNYTDSEGNDHTSIDWELPATIGEDIEIKLLPGFTGIGLKAAENGNTAVYNAETGVWTCDNVATTRVPEELAIKGLGTPKYWDGEYKNFGIDILFDKQEIDDQIINFSATSSHALGTNLDKADRDKALALGEYGIMDSVRNNIIIGGVFGDSEEVRRLSIYEMMQAAGDNTGDASAVLHLIPNATRVMLKGATNENFVAWNKFHVSNLRQNFTVTIKAGLRVPGVKDALGNYPVYETKRDYNYIYDYGEGKWYEGTELADIYKAQAQVVVDAIAKLPEVSEVKLSDKATVAAARELYDFMYYSESEEYVTNYQKLVDLEAKIAQLEAGSGNPDPGDNNGDNNGDDNNGDNNNQEGKKKCGSDIGGAASVSIAFLMLGMAAVVLTFKRGKKAE